VRQNHFAAREKRSCLPATNEVPGLRGYRNQTHNSISGQDDAPVDGPGICSPADTTHTRSRSARGG
jgi:hypothetical protein